jgi:two-component system OmpR family sensor kinase
MKSLNTLWVRLTLTFTVVLLVVVGIIAILINRTTDTEFRLYLTRSQVAAYGMEKLAAYYEANGSWNGVEELLAQSVVINALQNVPMPHRQQGGPEPKLDIVLADSTRKVVFDSAGASTGTRLASRAVNDAIVITEPDSDQVLGYLLVALPRAQSLGLTELRFLNRTRIVLFGAAALAIVLGLVIGALLSRSLTSPLQRLAAAARAVAGGHLGERVEVEGSAEVADVSRAFNEMTSALQKGETLRQNLMSDVAHELRTPLSVLQGNLRALLDDVYPLEKEEIARLYDETRLLSRLVDDLRELAQAEAGQLRFNMQPTDVVSLLRTAVAKFEPAAESRSVQLSCNVADALPQVTADPDRLAQVMNNLMTNALRHTPEGGRIVVSATAVTGAVEVSVTDNGEGIPAEDLPHVFDRFWRADHSRSRAGGGSGLGLAIVRAMVQAHGGQVRAASDGPGKGSTFSFTLPVC